MSKIKADRSKSVLPFLIPAMLLMAALIVFFVCITGGTPSVYANLIVIPVVVTALYAPVWYSVIFAALSGFAMGPLVDLVTDNKSKSFSFLIRVAVYVIVSVVVSYISSRNRQREKHFEHIATHDSLTDLPNFNCISSAKKLVFTISGTCRTGVAINPPHKIEYFFVEYSLRSKCPLIILGKLDAIRNISQQAMKRQRCKP